MHAKRVGSYDIRYREKSGKTTPGPNAPLEWASVSGVGYAVFQDADDASTEGVGRRNSIGAATVLVTRVTGWIKRYASG
jgi:hypothetical protein